MKKWCFQYLINDGKLNIGNNTSYNNAKIEIRSEALKNFITIGNDSIINGHYVIENASGNIAIGDRTFIGGGLFISINSINIGNDVMFSWGCTVMDNDAHSLFWKDRVNDVTDWKKGLDQNKIGKFKNCATLDDWKPII